MTPIVVLHDAGLDGVAWRDALRSWGDDVHAPDLVLDRASGDRTDVAWVVLEQMDAWRERRPIVVGCGEHALAAETFALAGWAGGLVLVDGLGGAWTTPYEQVMVQNEWLRAKFQQPDLATYAPVWVESFTQTMRANEHCPVLLVETPASMTPSDEVGSRAEQFGAPATIVRLDEAAPTLVVSAIRDWMGS